MNIGILGGGISAITLQRFLHHPSLILEKGERPGGLCRTFWKNGFGYDIGGHILFSKHSHVTDLVNQVLGDNVNHCRRSNTILFKGRYVKYPFENDLAALAPEDRYECLIGYLKAQYPPPTNLQEWALHTFGEGIAQRYLIPYNRKIWKLDPRQMGLTWVGRIPRPPMEDVVKSALGISTEGYTHQLYFRYPLEGGFEALVRAMAGPDAHIACGRAVQAVRQSGAGWRVHDGTEWHEFDRVVVAFPIHEAIHCLEGVPDQVKAAVAGLRYNPMRVVLVAVNNESLMERSAVYIPDETVAPHRVCFMGFFSPRMVRPGTSSLVAEVTMRPGDQLDRMSDDALIERVIDDLDRVGVISRADVIETDAKRIPYAYPVQDLEYAANVKILRDYFASLGIDLLGRFAEFEYINSDECIHRALLLAERLNALEGSD